MFGFIRIFLSIFVSCWLISANASANNSPVYVGFDGAYGVKNATSAKAIELGINVAIHEINAKGGVLGGRPLKLETKDNRSVPARGIANLKKFSEIKDLVAVFGGRFSPVILQQLETVHALEIPMLDVWGAANGITDHKYTPSYSFRLSLKDSWAMPKMLDRASELGATKVGVILPNTGWGRSNQGALNTASSRPDSPVVAGVIWYNWGEEDMLQHYQVLINNGAEAVIMVANDIEGSLLVRQLGENPEIQRVPILSHWGVAGGQMVKASGPTLNELQFEVVQTFSFFNSDTSSRSTFLETVKNHFGIDDYKQIDASVGVGHAYDMMHILAKAIDLAGNTNRSDIRDALEKVGYHEGIVRTYSHPFTHDRHDALSPEQVFMAKYRTDGFLIPLEYE